MPHVRLGLIGLGTIGQAHARHLLAGRVPRARLAAVGDADPARLRLYPGVPGFPGMEAMLKSGKVDAVLIATPHTNHKAAGVAALRAGVHVLIEKPLAVHKGECEALIAAWRGRGQVFAAMLNQRTDPRFVRLRRLIQDGTLGPVRRIRWVVTDWFRPAVYYALGGWRATWAGEGGGVLLNQALHNLDLFQWLFGMPARVHGFCGFGRYHAIEVEDDVTAYFEMPGGAHAVLETSTGEAPGANRLEVAAENGLAVLEGDRLVFIRNAVPASEFSRGATEPFARPATRRSRLRIKDTGLQHLGILRNFTAAILDGKPLLAPGEEGIHSVELANAILLSAWRARPVDLPMDATEYARWLRRKIADSKGAR